MNGMTAKVTRSILFLPAGHHLKLKSVANRVPLVWRFQIKKFILLH